MIKTREKNKNKDVYHLFILGILSLITFFGYRVLAGNLRTPNTDGQIIMSSQEYSPGTVYDRYGTKIVTGESVEIEWASDKTEEAFGLILGLDLSETLNSKTTIMGNCPWVYGTEDNRFSLQSLMNPFVSRIGGSVKLTLDKELQEYIYDLLQNYTYTRPYVVVSDYTTGEILATYNSVLIDCMHPGSTLKPILSAIALSLNPELEEFQYECIPENHDFYTEEGVMTVQCAGGESHGLVSMSDAIAHSCNGYFVSLMQLLDKNDVKKLLKEWGFDTEIAYEQFLYWDHNFIKDSDNDVDYLLAAIGQANAKITPLGLNLCTNILLNKGILAEPIWFNQKKVSPESECQEIVVNDAQRHIEEDIANRICEMMQGVTERGTGHSFYIPGFAAKTGTAQKMDEQGNLTDRYTVWTTGGLVDAETPYSVTVCLDDVPEEVTSSDAGLIAQNILLHMIGGAENGIYE